MMMKKKSMVSFRRIFFFKEIVDAGYNFGCAAFALGDEKF